MPFPCKENIQARNATRNSREPENISLPASPEIGDEPEEQGVPTEQFREVERREEEDDYGQEGESDFEIGEVSHAEADQHIEQEVSAFEKLLEKNQRVWTNPKFRFSRGSEISKGQQQRKAKEATALQASASHHSKFIFNFFPRSKTPEIEPPVTTAIEPTNGYSGAYDYRAPSCDVEKTIGERSKNND